LSGRGLCDELITRPEESYPLWCVVVCVLETSRMGAPYIYDISHLRVKHTVCLILSFLRYFFEAIWQRKMFWTTTSHVSSATKTVSYISCAL